MAAGEEAEMKKLSGIFGILLALGMMASTGNAIPQLINYQGYLTDDLGDPVTDGDYSLVFRIWDAETDGVQLWSEDHSAVTVMRGLFNVVLGSYSPLTLPFDVDYWLGVQVEGEPELPRVRLTSVGYSYRAGVADTADYAHAAQRDDDWLPDTSGLHIYRAGGNVGIGMVSLDSRLGVAGTAEVTGFKMTTGASSGHILTSDGSGVGTWQPPSGGGFWVLDEDVLRPAGGYGLSSRQSNVLYGDEDSTHVNLGVSCTTGVLGENRGYCAVGGGRNNTAGRDCATVGGGRENAARDSYATVSGGYGNEASYSRATVGGGFGNVASDMYTTVSGGQGNSALGGGASVGGGGNNVAGSAHATVAGGQFNVASSQHATVGGGQLNEARGSYSTIAGGWQNVADSLCATVGGGRENTADSLYTTIGGGAGNTAIGYGATVGGGTTNDAIGSGATVAGGSACEATGHNGAVGGGFVSIASGYCATVAGGYRATAAGDYSSAGGRDVTVDETADYTLAFGRDFTTSVPNAVVFHNSVDPIRMCVGDSSPTATLDVHGLTGHDQLRMRTSFTPSATSDTLGKVGDIAWDDDYVYIKTSVGWRRAALSSW